jgi:thioredoxin 1
MKYWFRWLIVLVVIAAAIWITLGRISPEVAENPTGSAISSAEDSAACACVGGEEFAEVLYQQDHEPSSVPTMVELGSKTCIPCRRMEKVMDELRDKYGDRIEIVFYNVKEDIEIARKYKIRVIPTQVFIDTTGREFFRHEGFFTLESIEAVFAEMGVKIDQ